jgi:hypothetical protein
MIYFIQSGDAVKIGYSADPKSRIKKLSTANPNCLLILGVMDGGMDEELSIHARFAKHHLRGEWFAIGDEIIEFIEQNCRPVIIRGGMFSSWRMRHPANDIVLIMSFGISLVAAYVELIFGINSIPGWMALVFIVSSFVFTYKAIKLIIHSFYIDIRKWRHEIAVRKLRALSGAS